MDKIKEAYEIATRDLRACYSKNGIVAGLHQFNNYWARDAFFASFGALELGDYVIVKKHLDLFLDRVSKGHYLLPKKIMDTRRIYVRGLIRRTTEGHLFTYRSRDQNSQITICAANYIRKTKDLDFAKKNYPKIRAVMMDDFAHDVDRNLLLEQGFYEDWADSLRKRGEILFTNVCHYQGLKELAYIAGVLKNKDEKKEYDFLAFQVKNRLNSMFWNGKYYIDSCGKGGSLFSSAGNMLAILWGIADKKQTAAIYDFIKQHKLENFTLESNYPKYKWWQISPIHKIIGLGDYHNGIRWLWLGCIDAAAKLKTGRRGEARELLEKISEKIMEFGNVYEVYERNGKPVRRVFYRSEVPFAWSSGLFVYAASQYLKGNKR